MAVLFKKALPADAAFLAPMNKRMIEDQHHRNPMGVPELRTRMTDWLQGEYEAWYAEEEGMALAYMLFKREPGEIYLRQFFVERESRRTGLGRKLFQWAELNLWRGAKVRLEVLPGNAAGIRFWESLGFAVYSWTMEKE
jgi:GNAT superfamily N-acetyltransferase